MPGVSKEQIAEAKRLDLLTYLENYEPHELVKKGPNEYTTATHDSLIISNGLWDWKSRKTESGKVGGRSALDYLIKVRGIGFVEAVQTLCNDRPAPVSFQSVKSREKPRAPFTLPPAHTNNNTVAAYLQGRGIDPAVIARCIHAGLLYENQKYHSCVFVGRDKAGTPRYAAIRGTQGDFKGEISGSDKRHGFTLPAEGRSDTVLVHEAPIDALSSATMERQRGGDQWKQQHYLSLGGVAPLALDQFLADHTEIHTVVLRLDNDRAGRDSAEAITNELESRGYTVRDEPPRFKKDYNQELQFYKQYKIRRCPTIEAAALTR